MSITDVDDKVNFNALSDFNSRNWSVNCDCFVEFSYSLQLNTVMEQCNREYLIPSIFFFWITIFWH